MSSGRGRPMSSENEACSDGYINNLPNPGKDELLVAFGALGDGKKLGPGSSIGYLPVYPTKEEFLKNVNEMASKFWDIVHKDRLRKAGL